MFRRSNGGGHNHIAGGGHNHIAHGVGSSRASPGQQLVVEENQSTVQRLTPTQRWRLEQEAEQRTLLVAQQQERERRQEREASAQGDLKGGLFGLSVDIVGGIGGTADYLASSLAIFQPRPAGALQAALSFDQRAMAAARAAANAAAVAVVAVTAAMAACGQAKLKVGAARRLRAEAEAASVQAGVRAEAQQAIAAAREEAQAVEDAEEEKAATARRRQRYERVLRAVYGSVGADSSKLQPGIFEQILDHWQHRPRADLLNLLGEKYGNEQRARASSILVQAEAE
jgi:hypothetical protein